MTMMGMMTIACLSLVTQEILPCTYQGERVFYAALNDELRELLRRYGRKAALDIHSFRLHMLRLLEWAQQSPAPTVGEKGEGSAMKNWGADTTLEVEGEKIMAHRFVLAARCSYFRSSFNTSLSFGKHRAKSHYCILLRNDFAKNDSGQHGSNGNGNETLFTSELTRCVLHWIYGGRIELTAQQVIPCRALCLKWGLLELLNKLPTQEEINAKGQITIDEGNDSVLASYGLLADGILDGKSISSDITIRIPISRSRNLDQNESMSDSNATIFHLHQTMLVSQSPYFSTMLGLSHFSSTNHFASSSYTQPSMESHRDFPLFREATSAREGNVLALQQMDPNAFRSIVAYLYSAKLLFFVEDSTMTSNSPAFFSSNSLRSSSHADLCKIYPVLEAAEMLLLPTLKTLCGSAIASFLTETLNEIDLAISTFERNSSNIEFVHFRAGAHAILDGLEIALRFTIDKLEEYCYSAIAKYFNIIFARPSMKCSPSDLAINNGPVVASSNKEQNLNDISGDCPQTRFEDMVLENAWSIQGRQAADSIPIIDGVRAALADLFCQELEESDSESDDDDFGQERKRNTKAIDDGCGHVNYGLTGKKKRGQGEYHRRCQKINSCLEDLELVTATGTSRGTSSGVLADVNQKVKWGA